MHSVAVQSRHLIEDLIQTKTSHKSTSIQICGILSHYNDIDHIKLEEQSQMLVNKYKKTSILSMYNQL